MSEKFYWLNATVHEPMGEELQRDVESFVQRTFQLGDKPVDSFVSDNYQVITYRSKGAHPYVANFEYLNFSLVHIAIESAYETPIDIARKWLKEMLKYWNVDATVEKSSGMI